MLVNTANLLTAILEEMCEFGKTDELGGSTSRNEGWCDFLILIRILWEWCLQLSTLLVIWLRIPRNLEKMSTNNQWYEGFLTPQMVENSVRCRIFGWKEASSLFLSSSCRIERRTTRTCCRSEDAWRGMQAGRWRCLVRRRRDQDPNE